MGDQFFLYTVTGLREPFYGVVDHETGRVWTAPTKDGAIRQAREAGIESFVERSITREKFLRSLGIETAPKPQIPRDPPPRQEPVRQEPRTRPGGAWFVADENVSADDAGESFSLPARVKSGKKSHSPGGGSPFAARPIAPPAGEILPESDDLLIIPSDHTAPAAPTPFTDAHEPEADNPDSDALTSR